MDEPAGTSQTRGEQIDEKKKPENTEEHDNASWMNIIRWTAEKDPFF